MKRRVEGDGEKRGNSETENIERADREESGRITLENERG